MIERKTGDYVNDAWRLIKPLVRLFLLSFVVLTVIVALGLKYFMTGSSWFYCVGSAAMLMIGLSLCVLSTAMAVRGGTGDKH